MRTLIFISVRVNSSRLPRKCFELIRGRPVIKHVIDRAKLIKGPEQVVICTSVESEDDVLETIARENHVLCFRGSLKDKLQRYHDAATKFGADYIVLFDGDDPFCDPELNELGIKQVIAEPCDFLKPPDGLALGAFGFIISASAIKKARELKDTNDTEMYEIYFSDPKLFKIRELNVGDPIFFDERARLTLDYQEDLNFFRRVFDELKMDTNVVPLRRIMEFLKKNPEIVEINMFRHKDYLAKREAMRATKKVKN